MDFRLKQTPFVRYGTAEIGPDLVFYSRLRNLALIKIDKATRQSKPKRGDPGPAIYLLQAHKIRLWLS